MSKNMNIMAPIVKVNTTADGGREVWGYATLEVVDKSGEIADADGTIKAFEKWADDAEKRSGGKSKGNIRVMHQPIVGGKAIHWEPTELQGEDGTTTKGVWLGSYVPPTKPDVIKDIDEGILTGYSIGGAYAKRWWDETAKAFRFIPELAEVSFVDNPCVPGADFVQVIGKAVPSVTYNADELAKDAYELAKDAYDDGSLEALRNRIARACEDAYRGPSRYWEGYVVRTFTDKVIVYNYDQDKYFSVPYEDRDGEIVLGQPSEVVQIESYVPVDALKAMREDFLQKVEVQEKESEKSVNVEMIKAMHAAGVINDEQMQKMLDFTKANDTPPASVNAPTVDGDGDGDHNKEFPNPPEGGEKANQSEANAGEKENEEALKSAPPAQEPNGDDDLGKALSIVNAVFEKSVTLEKAGKAISAGRAQHLHKAVGHITAALGGHAFDCGASGQGNTGEESPEVTAKALVGDLQKSMQTELSGIESLMKGLATSESLTKAFEPLTKAVETINSTLAEMQPLVKAIHDTPMPGGPALNGGSPELANLLGKGATGSVNMTSLEEQALLNLQKSTNDPQLRDRIGQEIALRQTRQIFGN